MTTIEEILAQVRDNSLDIEEAKGLLQSVYFNEVENTTIDVDRARRTGQAEVIFAQSKTVSQVLHAFERIRASGNNVLATRIQTDAAEALQTAYKDLRYSQTANIAALEVHPVPQSETTIAVISAGTSDSSVSEEAALTAEFFGSKVRRINDVGVAGIHRLLARIEEIRTCRVLVVVAGMEGALPSVVGGLVDKPVIAVPTSVGYGASFNGLAALLGMLNSCASGVGVVNIDNGFGAGFLAHRINTL